MWEKDGGGSSPEAIRIVLQEGYSVKTHSKMWRGMGLAEN